MNLVLAFHLSDEEAGKEWIAGELARLIHQQGREPRAVTFRVRRISSDAVLVRGSV